MNERNNSLILQIVIALSIVLTIIVNGILEALPLNGATSGEISDFYPSMFTPPGYVFSIWSVIYSLLIITAYYQIRSSQRDMPYLKWTAFFYVIGGIINTLWLTIFHLAYTDVAIYLVTPVLIFTFLFIGLVTYIKLGIGIMEVPISEKLGIHLPISVYIGWVSLASIANTASVLNVAIPAIPSGIQEMWTAVVIVIALLITLLMLILRKDIAYSLVVIWATVGIGLKQILIPVISIAAFGTAVIIAIAIILVPIMRKKSIKEFYLVKNPALNE